MQIFLTGTDTNVGKTLIASWLCLHSGYDYFKPIQTGSLEQIDSLAISRFSPKTIIHKEQYCYADLVAPYLAAKLANTQININEIVLPPSNNLIIEGAGGVLVPINQSKFMLDLIKLLKLPVIIVARSSLGTINHTLLTIEVLRLHKIKILGVIINGKENVENAKAIMQYGKVKILAQFPWLQQISTSCLYDIALTLELKEILGVS